MTPTYNYGIAIGWNIPDGSLTNVETLLGYPPRTQPVNEYPIRRVTLDQNVQDNGATNHEWPFEEGIPIAAIKTIEDTFYGGGTVSNANVTIRTRRHNRGEYARYNAVATLPKAPEDYEYDRGMARNLRWKFRDLTRL
jgi:hypothetical protein